jgi:hypothetical protein
METGVITSSTRQTPKDKCCVCATYGRRMTGKKESVREKEEAGEGGREGRL